MIVSKKNCFIFVSKYNSNLLNKFRSGLFSAQVSVKTPTTETKTIESIREEEWNSALPYEKIPGPSKLETLRSFLPGGIFHNRPRTYVGKILNEKYGDLVRLSSLFKNKDAVFCFNPDHFEKVYRNDGIWPIRSSFHTLIHYRHELRPELFEETGSLATSNGEKWGKFRSQVNPIMMQPKTVKTYIPRMDRSSLKFIDRIRKIRDPATNEMPKDFESEIKTWALEQICLVGLDNELGIIGNANANSDAQKLIDAVGTIFLTLDELEFKPSLWRYYATSNYKKLIKAYDVLTDISLKYIDEAFERFKANEKTDTRNDNEKSIVERLIKIDKRVAVIMAMDMFFAGVDTTTSTFTGAMLALSKNPEKQEKLRQEIRKILPEPDSQLTEKKLRNLPYLRAVIKESLRMYPVTHEFERTTNVDFTIGNYQIPKQTNVFMISAFQYKREEHFSNPETFIPERWLRESNSDKNAELSECPATKSSNPFIYLPFGFGNRMCVGKRFVDMELGVILARMVRNFNIEYNYDEKDVFELKLIYTPVKDLQFKLTDI